MRPPVAICTALAWESAAVRAGLRHVRREQKRVWRGFADDREVVVITGGVGPLRARQTLEPFMQTPFAALLSLGCAGALRSGLAAGHLILASEVYIHSEENLDHKLLRFPADRCLLAQGRTVAVESAIPMTEGALLTSSTALCSPAEKHEQGSRTGALAVEMESAAHAAFAAARKLPFLALRAILDSVEMSVPWVSDFVSPAGEARLWRAATAAVVRPSLVPRLLALKHAQTVAAQTLARICFVLLPILELPDTEV